MNKIKDFLAKDSTNITVGESLMFSLLFAVLQIIIAVLTAGLTSAFFEIVEGWFRRRKERKKILKIEVKD